MLQAERTFLPLRTGGRVRAAALPAWTGCALLVLLSALIFLLNTRFGIGVRPDTLRYMGLGWKPDDAPIYGALLRSLAALGIDIWSAAKLVGFLLALINPWLVWQLILRATGSAGYSAVGTALVVLSPQFSRISAIALSEPLFIACILASVLLFVKAVEARQPSGFVATGAMLAVTTLVRFPGLVAGAAMAAYLLLLGDRPLRERLRSVAILAFVGAVITVGWAIISKVVAGHAVGRDFALYGNADAARWLQGLNSLTALVLPTQFPLPFRLLVLGLLVGVGGWLLLRYVEAVRRSDHRVRAERAIAPVLGLTGLFYVAFMVLAVHLEANLPLNGRYALPLYVTWVMAAVIAAHSRQALSSLEKQLAALLVASGFALLAMHSVRTAAQTREAFVGGIDFASRAWASSPVIAAARRLPAGAEIYSNGPEAIIYAARRPATIIPMTVDSRTGRDRPHDPYPQQLERVRARLAAGNAYVIYVDGVDWRFYGAPEQELVETLDLQLIDRLPDGRIYARQQPASNAAAQRA